MTILRIGVVGLGAIAQSVHLPLISRRWDLFELAAVADASPALLADTGEQYGIGPAHRHESLAGLLAAESLDAIVLLTSGSHGADALAAIRQGVPVLCEKPLAFSLEEAETLRAAEEALGRPMLLLGYMKEYDPAVRALAAAMPAQGDVRYVGVEVLHPSGQSQLAYANLRPPAGDVPQEALAGFREADRLRLDSALGADAPDTVRKLYANVVLGSLIPTTSPSCGPSSDRSRRSTPCTTGHSRTSPAPSRSQGRSERGSGSTSTGITWRTIRSTARRSPSTTRKGRPSFSSACPICSTARPASGPSAGTRQACSSETGGKSRKRSRPNGRPSTRW